MTDPEDDLATARGIAAALAITAAITAAIFMPFAVTAALIWWIG